MIERSAAEFLARVWVTRLIAKPFATLILTTTAAIIFFSAITILDQIDRERRETKRLQSLDYQKQIQQLNEMESNVSQLLAFVNHQKKVLQETEDTIAGLKSEREKLQPLVDTERAAVEALFKAQEERVSANVWRERWIGFAFGLLASLIASFILFVIDLLVSRKYKESN